MRIGAVITIIGAHDARNAAYRLTVPVPDGSCRATILAGSGGDTMNAVEAAGRPALTRPGAAASHPVTGQRHGHHRRFSSRAPGGACRRAGAIAAALGRGFRPLTPALLGAG
jgi:hypothetical protein